MRVLQAAHLQVNTEDLHLVNNLVVRLLVNTEAMDHREDMVAHLSKADLVDHKVLDMVEVVHLLLDRDTRSSKEATLDSSRDISRSYHMMRQGDRGTNDHSIKWYWYEGA